MAAGCIGTKPFSWNEKQKEGLFKIWIIARSVIYGFVQNDIPGGDYPKPTYCLSILITQSKLVNYWTLHLELTMWRDKPSPIIMNHVSCIFKLGPSFPYKNVTPCTISLQIEFKTTYLLHTADLGIFRDVPVSRVCIGQSSTPRK